MTTLRWEPRLVIFIRRFGPFDEGDLEKAGFDKREVRIFKLRFDRKCKIIKSRAVVGLSMRPPWSEKEIERKEKNMLDRLEDYLENRAYWGE